MSQEWPKFERLAGPNRAPERHEERLPSSDFLNELQSQAEYHLSQPGGDKYIAAFNLAVLKAYQQSSAIKDLIENYLDTRTDIRTPSHAANLPLRAFQKQLLRQAGDAYPSSFSQPDDWLAAMQTIIEDPSCEAELNADLKDKLVQSNKSERYASIKALIRMYGDQLGDEPRILDIGCSRNHGLKKIALNLPFQPITSRLGHQESRFTTYQSSFTDLINQLIKGDVMIGQSMGSDVIDISENGEWAKACSFYPSELEGNQEDVIEYDALDAIGIPDVGFVQADFKRRQIAHLPGYRAGFDMVVLSTVMYQLSEAERIDMLSNALWHVKDGGIVVVQDFAAKDPCNPKRLVFRDHWFNEDYPYRTFVLEVGGNSSLSGFKEFFRWKTSRCRDVVLMPAAINKLSELL